MKRSVIFILLSLLSLSLWSKPSFVCEQLIKDHNEFAPYIQNNYFSESWAKKMYETHPVSDKGRIEYIYIINASEDFNIDNLLEATKEWINVSSPQEITITRVDKQEKCIEAKINLGMLAGKFGGIKLSLLFTDLYVKVSFKSNRVRFQVYGDRYNMFVLSDGSPKSSNTFIKDVFPITANKNHEALYAKGFIRVNCNCNKLAYDYLTFLNKKWDGEGCHEEDW